MIGQEGAGRVGDLAQAGLGHLEDADLVRRAEPVLRRAQQTQRRVALAFEVDDRVDQVLERLRAGDRAVLGHVPDEDDRDAVALGEIHQAQRRLADLADAPGRALELVDRRGLDRIDDHQARSLGPGDLDDPTDVVLGEDPHTLARWPVEQAEASRPQPDLAGRLLARGIQHAGRPARRVAEARRGLEQERRLADPGLAAEQHERSGHEPAAEDPVELGDAEAACAAGRLRRCRPVPPARWLPRPPPGRATVASASARARRSRPACSSHRTRGTGLPSGGRPPRTTGRRSGSGAAPSLGRRSGGAAHRASTGVRGSARWMSRPASGSRSTTIVEPGSYVPSRSCSASTSSIMFWMTRRSGRAPYATS